jgi:NADPH:quinone reductase-like Zn-dependent oxidoreductase
MLRAIDQHRIRTVIDRVFAFEQLKDAMAYLRSGAQFGKICLRH